MAKEGKAIIFSAPSGAGKTTLVRHLLKNKSFDLEFSVSATTREKRNAELNGIDYYFLSEQEFKDKIKKDEFYEWEEVYNGTFYGTLKSEIHRIWKAGKHVIFDVDVNGGINLKQQLGDKALSVFVMPPSIEALEIRLRGRNTESDSRIEARMTKAVNELKKSNEFDIILLNDVLEDARAEAEKIAKDFLLKAEV
ncbi:MAG: guanylate kinase [Luteibaculaceae bacterium]